jgi:hypothetical protein
MVDADGDELDDSKIMTVGFTCWARARWISRRGHWTRACPLCMRGILSDISTMTT